MYRVPLCPRVFAPDQQKETLRRVHTLASWCNFRFPSLKRNHRPFSCELTACPLCITIFMAADAEALRALYEATSGAGWARRDNWLDGAPCDPPILLCDFGLSKHFSGSAHGRMMQVWRARGPPRRKRARAPLYGAFALSLSLVSSLTPRAGGRARAMRAGGRLGVLRRARGARRGRGPERRRL